MLLLRMLVGAMLGAALGLAYAIFYSIYILVLYLVRGSAPFDAHGVTLLETGTVYFLGGLAAGTLAGLLHTLARTAPGAVLVGAISAGPVGLLVHYSTEGLHVPPDWLTIVSFSLALGGPVGLVLRHQFGRWFGLALGEGQARDREPDAPA